MRLVTANGPWGAGTFSYDGLDNIRSKALGPRTVSIAYDGASNLVQSVLDSADGTARPWVHDLRGNVTDNGQVAITYDFAGQPLAIAKGAVTQFHRYDGHKKRVRTIEGSKTTYWVYSTLTGTPVYQEAVQSGASTGTHYVAVPGANVRLKAGDLTYTHLDHQGSPVVATAGLMGGEALTRACCAENGPLDLFPGAPQGANATPRSARNTSAPPPMTMTWAIPATSRTASQA